LFNNLPPGVVICTDNDRAVKAESNIPTRNNKAVVFARHPNDLRCSDGREIDSGSIDTIRNFGFCDSRTVDSAPSADRLRDLPDAFYEVASASASRSVFAENRGATIGRAFAPRSRVL
jgi:hypothetical protein